MRILLTGGAGCLGSSLIEHWLPKGHELLVLDNFATGKRELVPPVDGLTLVEGSVCNEALVHRVFSEFAPAVVIHAAASYKDPRDWSTDVRTNVLGSVCVAHACERMGVSRLVNFQTALCYGRPSRTPIPITHTLAPFTSYGVSKTAGEQFLLMAGVPVVSLRIANVTGPRLAIGPLPTFYKRLKAGQKCFCSAATRDFLDMADFLRLVDRAIEPTSPTGVFHASSGEGHTIREIFNCVADHLRVPRGDVPEVPVGDDDVAEVVLDASRTAQAFGWRAEISFEAAVRRQLEWYDRHGVTDVHSHLMQPAAGPGAGPASGARQ